MVDGLKVYNYEVYSHIFDQYVYASQSFNQRQLSDAPQADTVSVKVPCAPP